MAREDKSTSFYRNVTANTRMTREFTIPNGEVWQVQHFTGDANPNRDTYVGIVWDFGGTNEIVTLAYGSVTRELFFEFTGDGVKKLAVVLQNNSPNTEALGVSASLVRVS